MLHSLVVNDKLQEKLCNGLIVAWIQSGKVFQRRVAGKGKGSHRKH